MKHTRAITFVWSARWGGDHEVVRPAPIRAAGSTAALAVFALVLGLIVPDPAGAAAGPNRVNYQGVLRDQNDMPLTGTYDMLFRFMDAETAGNEIMIDQHAAATGNAITVSGGLLDVVLGTGTVTDGSGPGTYTLLSSVFGDHTDVWLEIQVDTEILSPRTQIQSVPYALNASNLAGHASSYFLDTSSSPQSKNGPLILTISDSSTAPIRAENLASSGIALFGRGGGIAVQGRGTSAGSYGGEFVGGYLGLLGVGQIGGRFGSSLNAVVVDLATDVAGIFVHNDIYYGGAFDTHLANSTGVYGRGDRYGGDFAGYNTGNSVGVRANGYTGVLASGATLGGIFTNNTVGVAARLADGAVGISATGSNVGGYFSNGSSTAYLPYTDRGIEASGSFHGGHFTNAASSADAYVGTMTYKIFGNGSVNFVQNHPHDPSKVIVYAAPEGDEVAVYTRGSGRLVDGEARVKLGETFELVTNPDIGLTATATARGKAIPLGIIAVSPSELSVSGPPGSDAEFDYMVWGLRIGFEEQSVVQPKQKDFKIPSMHQHEKFFEDEPALQNYTALARFKGIEQAVHGKNQFDFSRADTLRDAVGVFPYREPPVNPADVPGRPAIGPMSRPPQSSVAGSGAGAAATAPRTEPGAPSSAEGESGAGESGGPAAVDEVPTSHARTHSLDVFSAEGAIAVGDVVSLAVDSPGSVILSEGPDDKLVIGCAQVSEAGSGRAGTSQDDQATLLTGHVAVATSRVAVCRVDASYGAISVGDRLSPSPTAGMAMKLDPGLAGATILGRAIDPLDSGSALVRVLLGAR